MPKYKVLRSHLGDRPYNEGDTREIADSDAAELVRMGVLQRIDDGAVKAEKPVENKADPKLMNKAAKG